MKETIEETNGGFTIPLKPNFGQTYVMAIKYLEQFSDYLADKTGVDPALDNCYRAGQTLLELIEAMALYGSATTCNLDAVLRRVKDDAFPEMAMLRQAREEVAAVFSAEADFCASMQRMVQMRILEAAGVDPQDEVAVQEYFRNAGNCLMFKPATNAN